MNIINELIFKLSTAVQSEQLTEEQISKIKEILRFDKKCKYEE